jgi:ATP-dependent DNA helicase RecG
VNKTPISILFSAKSVSKTLEKLLQANIAYQEDLLWIFPLRVYTAPKAKPFSNAIEGQFFRGSGKIISRKISPSYAGKGKRGIRLFNINLIVQDHLSDELLTLTWFNSYPNIQKIIKELESIYFEGLVSINKTTMQIVGPKLLTAETLHQVDEATIREYPTLNKIPGKTIKLLIDKIPNSVFQNIKSFHKNKLPLLECFKILHGLADFSSDRTKIEVAREEIVYQEFFGDQLKVMARKKVIKQRSASVFQFKQAQIETALSLHSFIFTEDQKLALNDILNDLNSGTPMMRMIQGDVGCGKTAVAISASFLVLTQGGQVALMCPTETLARQHYQSFLNCYKQTKFKVHLLVGSTKKKERDIIDHDLINCDQVLVIGTHTLFQDSVSFKNLQLAIIDEQHKFGVEQRLKLLAKGVNSHCLIMTATPIPRTLRLTQFGDLDLTTIRTIPIGRKGIKTRIVESDNMQNYYSFLKTRLELKEQIFIVVPAIEESENSNLETVENIYQQYKSLFPSNKISFLHGKMKSDEKDLVIGSFANNQIDLLVATSVIEVGINIPTATVISIYNPDRFGLSSLHQLRGRVGRGDKTGFCFLVCMEKLNPAAKNRLIVLEETTDGFIIAEKDLEFRGEGDLFGRDQSGVVSNYKIADIYKHRLIFEQVTRDLAQMQIEQPAIINQHILNLIEDDKIASTI